MKALQFSGKKVVITGAAQGIGLALARAFLDQGAQVAVMDIQPVPLEADLVFEGDLARQEDLEIFAVQCIDTLGQVDLLVNNAMRSGGGIDACSYDDFVDALRVGVAAPYYLTRLLLPAFSRGASVINLSSTRAFQSQAQTEPYSAAKGGITALTHALAVSLAGRARVNAIAPGWIDVTGAAGNGADQAQHPVKRVGQARDIVQAVFFLASEEAGFITGQTLVVDGGMSKLMVYHGDQGWQYHTKRTH